MQASAQRSIPAAAIRATWLLIATLIACLAAPGLVPAATLDVDGDGSVSADTDGQLILRHLFGFTADTLVAGVVSPDAVRNTTAIQDYLDGLGENLDVDGDGHADALTDGILRVRYMLGRTGEGFTAGVLSPTATRASADEILAYIEAIRAPLALNQALLGPLSGATINAYRLEDLQNPVEGPIQAATDGTDLDLAGTFGLALADIPGDTWILVTATGGEDVDADDDGIPDQIATPNQGTLHALARARDWRVGGLKVNVLTDLAWRDVQDLRSVGDWTELDARLRWLAAQIMTADTNGDGRLDYRDLAHFSPRVSADLQNLEVPYSAFTAPDEQGRSYLEELRAGDPAAVQARLDQLFGDSLQPPPAPELTDTLAFIDLPENRAGLTAEDLSIASIIAADGSIADQGATLMYAHTPDGRTILYGYAITGEMPELSPHSTALALVMLLLGPAPTNEVFMARRSLVEGLPGFDDFSRQVRDLMVIDPGFLDRLTDYGALVADMRALAEAASTQAGGAAEPIARARAAKALPLFKDRFYCVHDSGNPWISAFIPCSPWKASQPWHWYGEATGLTAFFPDHGIDVLLAISSKGFYLARKAYVDLLPEFTNAPFLAISQADPTELATANPNAAQYALEVYSDRGLEGWRLVPRNTSISNKLLNSGAAKRSLFSVTNEGNLASLDPTIERVTFNRWPSPLTTHGQALLILNATHLVISTLNLMHDFTAARETLNAIAKNEDAINVLATCGKIVADVARDQLRNTPWDATRGYAEQFQEFVADALPHLVAALTSPLAYNCLGDAAKSVGGKSWSRIFGQQVVASTLDALGTIVLVKVLIDAGNDAVPTYVSMAWPSAESRTYYLSWGEDEAGNPIVVDISDSRPARVTQPLLPTAQFTATQPAGDRLTVHFDAASSTVDSTATPVYRWDFGDGSTALGAQVSRTYASAGIRTITLTLDDGLGNVAARTSRFDIGSGAEPQVESLDCRLDPNEPHTVLIDVSVTDPDGDLARLTWWRSAAESANGTTPALVTGPDVASLALNYPDATAAPFAPVLVAEDSAGRQATRSCLVQVPRAALPEVPTGVSPGDAVAPGSILASNTVTLSWAPAAGATYYDLGVRDLETGLLVVDTVTTARQFTFSADTDKPYRWNVAACNALGCVGYHNTRRYFQTPHVADSTAFPLNDTGIDWCGDGSRNFRACPVDGYPWQDAQDGRDATHNDDSDGHAGFSFTKLDANGNPLPSTATHWSCVRDNVTGLVWEVKTDDGGLRDKDWTYSWYNPDSATNGGFAGYADYGDNCYDASRCDTHKFVADVNARGLCGARDWRLPNVRELLSIVANDRVQPAIDTRYFPNTQPFGAVWSSSPDAYHSGYAWYVEFHDGDFYDGNSLNPYDKYDGHYVRLVRGGQ